MKILVTGAWRHTEIQIAQICELGHSVVLVQDETASLPCDYDSIEGVICNGLFVYHPIDKFKNLKYIQLTSAGFDRVPMDYVEAHNIAICNARGVYSIPMAEYALSSVLTVYKKVDYFRSSQSSRSWNKHRGLRELYGKRVCILGCGSVGSECALRFSAMGCDVVGVDTLSMQKDGYRAILPVSDLRDVVKSSDVLVLTLPLTKKTERIVDNSILKSLPEGAVIVNIARAAVVDNKALIKVLEERSDITAILDVFEDEPLPFENHLWNMKNVLITPHNSFVGDGNADRLWRVIINNLKNQV